MWIALSVLLIGVVVGISIWKSRHNAMLEKMRVNGAKKNYSEDEIERLVEAEAFPLPAAVRPTIIGLAFLAFGAGMFHQVFFYAEPGFIYHVRTIFGEERVVSGTGYHYHLLGRVNDWKREMSVQASGHANSAGGTMDSENESANMSASLPSIKLIMLDQVDAKVQATARFQLPTDPIAFLKIAHSYRSPENLLRTSLIPQFQETLKATASLMGAEEYYSGGRTQFQNDFETQMMSGIYVVKRTEKTVAIARPAKGSANASKGVDQEEYGEDTKTVFLVEKVLDENQQPKIKQSKSTSLGIVVVESRITDLEPNEKFSDRMKLKQKASADRAIAKEQRIQEEEQKLLAVATGEREVAQRQAKAKVEQIEKTTNAETDKQLAITKASKQLERAKIEKATADVVLEKDKVTAQSVKVLADAEAYKKKAIITADNALQQKLSTEIEIQKVWAEAYANRAVPQYVIGGGAGGANGTPVGADGEVKNFMQLMTIDAAKRLNYDRGLDASKPAK